MVFVAGEMEFVAGEMEVVAGEMKKERDQPASQWKSDQLSSQWEKRGITLDEGQENLPSAGCS